MSASGQCVCGDVKFTVDAVESEFHSCHCSICRRWAGGPTMAATVEQVNFTGDENIARFASSDWGERGFCRRCGSHLFFYLKPSDQYMMEVGAFDDQTPFSLVGEIYVDEKPDSYAFAGEHPRLTGEEFLASIGMSDPKG